MPMRLTLPEDVLVPLAKRTRPVAASASRSALNYVERRMPLQEVGNAMMISAVSKGERRVGGRAILLQRREPFPESYRL